jgi:hypothetical protein
VKTSLNKLRFVAGLSYVIVRLLAQLQGYFVNLGCLESELLVDCHSAMTEIASMSGMKLKITKHDEKRSLEFLKEER